MSKLLILLISVLAVASQLCLKRGVIQLGGLNSLGELPRFAWSAARSPWIMGSLCMQALGYVGWMAVATREKQGVAVALAGAFFYILMAAASWIFYNEQLSVLQALGVGLIILGVFCLAGPLNGP